MNKRISPKVVRLNKNAPTSVRVPDGTSKATVDSLQNLITGMGVMGRDKNVSTQFTLNTMDRAQLESAYRADWIARKVVRIPAEDATREWRVWQAENADIELIEDAERDLFLQRKLFTAMWKGRLYGGAALLLGVNQGKLSEELIPEKVEKDALKYIHVVTRHELAAGPILWDIDSPYYGLPEYYTRAVTNDMSGKPLERVHPSRLIRFIGNELPDLQVSMGWGDSVLQAVNDAVISAGTATAAGAQLLQEIKMDIIKIPELSASLANKAYEKRLLDRFGMANLAKSLYNILLMDKDEDWERVSQNFTGLDDLLKMYLLIASGAADIPATRFLGQSPAGLTATGESDIRNYYDKIKSDQQCELSPNIDVLDRVLIRSVLGDVKDGDVVYSWKPLWQMDDEQKATIATAKAGVYTQDVAAAQIPPDVLRDARINQLIEDGTYPGLEQILEDYGELETLEQAEEEPAMLIGPDGELLEPDPDLTPANENVAIEAVKKTRAEEALAKIEKKKAVGDWYSQDYESFLIDFLDGSKDQPRDPKGVSTGGQWASTGEKYPGKLSEYSQESGKATALFIQVEEAIDAGKKPTLKEVSAKDILGTQKAHRSAEQENDINTPVTFAALVGKHGSPVVAQTPDGKLHLLQGHRQIANAIRNEGKVKVSIFKVRKPTPAELKRAVELATDGTDGLFDDSLTSYEETQHPRTPAGQWTYKPWGVKVASFGAVGLFALPGHGEETNHKNVNVELVSKGTKLGEIRSYKSHEGIGYQATKSVAKASQPVVSYHTTLTEAVSTISKVKATALTKRAQNYAALQRARQKSSGYLDEQDSKIDTLYVYRTVLNAEQIINHYKEQGVPDLFDEHSLHVTICYSRRPVDWTKAGEPWTMNEDGTLIVKPGGMRTHEKYGMNSLVLLFNSNDLIHRHQDIQYRTEAQWEYQDYTPHITIAEMDGYDWSGLEPYKGIIVFGPEIFEPVKTSGAYA